MQRQECHQVEEVLIHENWRSSRLSCRTKRRRSGSSSKSWRTKRCSWTKKMPNSRKQSKRGTTFSSRQRRCLPKWKKAMLSSITSPLNKRQHLATIRVPKEVQDLFLQLWSSNTRQSSRRPRKIWTWRSVKWGTKTPSSATSRHRSTETIGSWRSTWTRMPSSRDKWSREEEASLRASHLLLEQRLLQLQWEETSNRWGLSERRQPSSLSRNSTRNS